MIKKKHTEPKKDTRVSAEIGSGLSMSPEDERDLASLVNPALHPHYNAASGWWTVALLVTTTKGRPTYEGKGRTYVYALSAALAHWRIDKRKTYKATQS